MVFSRHIIVFLGPVGVGKSTQRELVAQSLRVKGIKVSSTQLKALHIFSNLLFLSLMLLLNEKSNKNHYRVFRSKRVSVTAKLFPLVALLDIPSFILRYWFTISLPMKFGRVVLVEEYMYATLAEYLFLIKKMKTNNSIASFFIFLVNKLLLKNKDHTTTVYLNATFDCLTDRISSRNTYTEDPNYMNMQKSTLLSIAKTFSVKEQFYYVDTTNMDTKTVNHQILPIVEKVLIL